MDKRLDKLKIEYRKAVEQALALLDDSGVVIPKSKLEWALNGMEGTGTLDNGASYRKHGYGISVRLQSGEVDFDFGLNGEVEEPDPFRLISFGENRISELGFSSLGELEQCFATDS